MSYAFEDQMSKIRFERAKHYIQERDYDKAREILETMPDNPTAQKWLTKLNEIDPPFPDVEPDAFTDCSPVKEKRIPSSNAALDEEAQKAQNRGLGVFLFVIGACVASIMLISNPASHSFTIPLDPGFGSVSVPASSSYYMVTAIIVGLGIFVMCLGIYLFWYAGRTDKIRDPLAKSKAKRSDW